MLKFKEEERLFQDRATQLRMKKDVSEAAMSLALGNHRTYLQSISNGRANGIPRIIDDNTFNKVQIIMEKNKKAPAGAKAVEDNYILTTKIFCGLCGAYLVGDSWTR